ncbi:MAG TPA: pseudouridine synthase [Tissierellaceae bacterium]|nr:pseudouridine synthase [Tissierellaceae bacterium]
MRLQKFMAQCGVASRRKSESIILEGNVKINGRIVTKLGTKIDPKKDTVCVNNQIIKIESKNVYIMLNKPKGYVTTLKDEKCRKIVTDLISNINERIYPVGRLDKDTTGLLLLTNDGDLTYVLTHPSKEIIKRYIARVEGVPNKSQLHQFRTGLKIDGQLTSPAKVNIIKQYKHRNEVLLDIRIHEGKNRQVRKMCQSIGHPVKRLKRISIEQLELGDLKVGDWRHLTLTEINYLKSL